MWTVLSVSFIIVVFIFGLTELFRLCWLRLLRPKEDPPRVMLVMLRDTVCVQQLRSAMEYISWEGRHEFSCVAAVDCGLSPENCAAVRKIADAHSDVIFGTAELERFLAEAGVTKK